MNSSLSWPLPARRAPRSWLSLAVVAVHGLVFWALLQLHIVEQVVRHAAPLMVRIVGAPRPPAPAPPLAVPPPRLAPPPLLTTVPVPEVQLREPPPPALAVQPAAPTPAPPATQPPAATAAVAPVLPPPPAPQTLAASAVRYLVEPPVQVPRASRRLRESGHVLLRVLIDVRGQPRDVTLLRSSGFERLDQQALGAMRQARIVPCTDNGRPVECVFDAPIVYDLEN